MVQDSISKIGTNMTLLCAADDFVQRTLAYVPGTWGKLRYVASLRNAGDQYEHWGLARKYGETAAQRAIEDAHRELVQQVLRTPIRSLVADARVSAAAAEQHPFDFVQQLASNTPRLLPPGAGRASARHLTAVLLSLISLVHCGAETHYQFS